MHHASSIVPRIRVSPVEYFKLIWKAINCWIDDGASHSGAAIAYYTLFALAPMLLVVIAITGAVFGEEAVRGEIVTQIGGLIGDDGATAVQEILKRAQQPREGVLASVLGVVGLVFAATGAFLELQAALNNVWKVKSPQVSGIDVKGLVKRRLRSFAAVVSIAFLLLVSLAVNAAVSALSTWLGTFTPGWPVVLVIFNQLVSLFVTAALFGLLFRVLPDVHLRWRDVALGAITTAVLFAAGQRLIGLYLGHSALASPFGAAGTIAIILVWVYYSTQIVLLGAELTRVFAEHRGTLPAPR